MKRHHRPLWALRLSEGLGVMRGYDDHFCEVIADAIPGPERDPLPMHAIVSRINEPGIASRRREIEQMIAALVDANEVAMFALGPRTMGNGKDWLHYRWTPM